jgi:hypothetical protein
MVIGQAHRYKTEVTATLVPIVTADAIKALRLCGRIEASQWWQNWYSEQTWLKERSITPINPHILIFRSAEGETFQGPDVQDNSQLEDWFEGFH